MGKMMGRLVVLLMVLQLVMMVANVTHADSILPPVIRSTTR